MISVTDALQPGPRFPLKMISATILLRRESHAEARRKTASHAKQSHDTSPAYRDSLAFNTNHAGTGEFAYLRFMYARIPKTVTTVRYVVLSTQGVLHHYRAPLSS